MFETVAFCGRRYGEHSVFQIWGHTPLVKTFPLSSIIWTPLEGEGAEARGVDFLLLAGLSVCIQ